MKNFPAKIQLWYCLKHQISIEWLAKKLYVLGIYILENPWNAGGSGLSIVFLKPSDFHVGKLMELLSLLKR